jgi:putative tricarboxylic transport membrane protein
MRVAPQRRPGEAVFMVFLSVASLGLLIKAYGIAGLESLSSPGALPMAAAGVMTITAAIIAYQSFRAQPDLTESLRVHILPASVIVAIIAITAFAFLLQPLGFLITSFLFLFVLIKVLSGRSLFFCAWVSAANVLLIYLVFRIVFTVLMPEGIVPEREIIAAIGRLLTGGR